MQRSQVPSRFTNRLTDLMAMHAAKTIVFEAKRIYKDWRAYQVAAEELEELEEQPMPGPTKQKIEIKAKHMRKKANILKKKKAQKKMARWGSGKKKKYSKKRKYSKTKKVKNYQPNYSHAKGGVKKYYDNEYATSVASSALQILDSVRSVSTVPQNSLVSGVLSGTGPTFRSSNRILITSIQVRGYITPTGANQNHDFGYLYLICDKQPNGVDPPSGFVDDVFWPQMDAGKKSIHLRNLREDPNRYHILKSWRFKNPSYTTTKKGAFMIDDYIKTEIPVKYQHTTNGTNVDVVENNLYLVCAQENAHDYNFLVRLRYYDA